MNNTIKAYKFFREKPDGTVTIGDSDEPRLNVEEFRNLQALMPGVGWIGFYYPRPIDICNDAYVPSADHALFLENFTKDPTKFLTFKKPIEENGNNNI